MVEAWRLYYAEGEFSSADGRWEDAPAEGVQAVKCWLVPNEQAETWVLCEGDEYACLADGTVLEVRYVGGAGRLPLPPGQVKCGELLPDADFAALRARVLADTQRP